MNRNQPPNPPRIAEFLLGLLLPRQGIRESVLGDLHELFIGRADDPDTGSHRARLWYWSQALRLGAGYGARRLRGVRYRGFTGPARPRDTRDAWGGVGMGMIRQMRFSVRSMIRSPGFSGPVLLWLLIAQGLICVRRLLETFEHLS